MESHPPRFVCYGANERNCRLLGLYADTFGTDLVVQGEGKHRQRNPLLKSQDANSANYQASKSLIYSLKFQERGSMVAVSSQDGAVNLLGLNEGLAVPYKDEKLGFGQVSGLWLRR